MITFDGLLLRKFSLDRADDVYCDITLVVEDTKFRCHKFLLGAVSRYFHGLFRNHFKDSQSDQLTLTTPHGLTSSVCELVVKYIYTEEISLNERNVFDVLLTANYFEIPHLEVFSKNFTFYFLAGTLERCSNKPKY